VHGYIRVKARRRPELICRDTPEGLVLLDVLKEALAFEAVGYSIREIAEELGIPKSTVADIMGAYKDRLKREAKNRPQ
jgi:hypothetical protein